MKMYTRRTAKEPNEEIHSLVRWVRFACKSITVQTEANEESKKKAELP